MKMEKIRAFLCLWVGIVCSFVSLSCRSEAADTLSFQAEKFLRQQIDSAETAQHTKSSSSRFELEVGPLDARLRLPTCTTPLQFQTSQTELLGRISIKASCRSAQGWSVHIPATIRQFRPVAVAARSIPRGTALDAAAITLKNSDLSVLPQGYFTDSQQIVDQVARRDIAPGELLRQGLFEAQRLVKRGDEVVILAEADGLTVRSTGIALGDGAAGKQIDVKNGRSERIIRVRVLSHGTVTVQL